MTLSFDPETLELPFYHFIGGERVDATGTLEMRRPSDGGPMALVRSRMKLSSTAPYRRQDRC